MDRQYRPLGCSLPFWTCLLGVVMGLTIVMAAERIPFSQAACTAGIVGGLTGLLLGQFAFGRSKNRDMPRASTDLRRFRGAGRKDDSC